MCAYYDAVHTKLQEELCRVFFVTYSQVTVHDSLLHRKFKTTLLSVDNANRRVLGETFVVEIDNICNQLKLQS